MFRFQGAEKPETVACVRNFMVKREQLTWSVAACTFCIEGSKIVFMEMIASPD
jgi:hypothetical protein